MALPTASDNQWPKLIIRESANDGSDFSNPATDYRVLFVGEDGDIHLMDSAGTVTDFPAGGGSSSGDTELSYVEQTTSDTSVTATVEANSETFITADALVFDGSTRVEIEVFIPRVVAASTAGALIAVILFDDTGGGAASIGFMGAHRTPAAAVNSSPFKASRFLTPSAATHTYSARLWVSTGTGRAECGAGGAGADIPAYIRIVTAPAAA